MAFISHRTRNLIHVRKPTVTGVVSAPQAGAREKAGHCHGRQGSQLRGDAAG